MEVHKLTNKTEARRLIDKGKQHFVSVESGWKDGNWVPTVSLTKKAMRELADRHFNYNGGTLCATQSFDGFIWWPDDKDA